MKSFGVFVILFLYAIPTHTPSPDRLIVWNVGQGSWTTITDSDVCVHLDMGGEFIADERYLLQECRAKINIVAITHLDRDHINFIFQMQKKLTLCVAWRSTLPPHARLHKIAECKAVPKELQLIVPSSFREKNDSHIYLWKSNLLVTGDSYRRAELRLLRKLQLAHIRYLLVGHHGSRTSSHPRFVKSLRHLQQAIVSARRKKYGHPHPLTKEVYRKYGKPLLATEDFGTLIIELN